MSGRSLKLFVTSLMVLSLVAAACAKKSPTTSGAGPSVNPSGTITYALEKEPSNYNILDDNLFEGLQIMDRVWPSVFHADPDVKLFLDKDFMVSADVASTSPQVVVYKINPKAKWSDGMPINADDFVYNWQAQSGLPQYNDIDGKPFNAASTTGYQQISSITFSPDKFTVTTTYTTPFADWKSLFSTIAPAHILKTVGFNGGLLSANINDKTLISGGPFMFGSYTPGKDFILKRNPNYWGTPSNLAQVDYRFITDSTQQEPALANNEIQAFYPQPQLDLLNQLKQVQGISLDQKPGLQYEHLDFNEANQWLKDLNLRKAIAMAIDRPDLIAKTVGQFAPGIVPDNNHIYVPGQPQYKDNSSGVTGTVTGTATSTATSGPYDHANLDGAKALLTSNGYTLSTGANPTLSKGGKPVTLNITSTQGNALRASEEQVIINDLAPLGIKVTEKDTPKLTPTLKAGAFDMIIFAWVDTPFTSGNDDIFKSKGGSNYDSYSNKTVDSLIAQADVSLDPTQVASLYNQVDAILWNELVTLPLFQKPTLLVYQKKYHNMRNNITSEGPVYNEEQWAVS